MERNYYKIDENRQRQANNMMSYSSYKMGSKTEEYKKHVDSVYDWIDNNITDSDGIARAYYYADKYAEGLAEWYNKDASITLRCPSVLIAGPSNFPTKKKEKQIQAWDSNMRFREKVDSYITKIKGIARGQAVIQSDDVNAIAKLENKIKLLKDKQELMKSANKAIRLKDTAKGNKALHELGFSDKQITELREPDFCGRVGYPSFELTNNNANIHRLEGRLKELKAEKEHEQKADDWSNPYCKVVENKDIMRIQLIFDGKPDEETRSLLKSNGFRWSPHYTAWQRQLNSNGRYAVKYVLKKLAEMENK